MRCEYDASPGTLELRVRRAGHGGSEVAVIAPYRMAVLRRARGGKCLSTARS